MVFWNVLLSLLGSLLDGRFGMGDSDKVQTWIHGGFLYIEEEEREHIDRCFIIIIIILFVQRTRENKIK